ncbi:MAG: DUF3854 domain-containing protein [Polyangiaceae bacterium]
MTARGIDPDLAYREGARSMNETQIQSMTRVSVQGGGLGYSYSHLEHAEHCRVYVRVHLDDAKVNNKKVVCPKVTPPPFFMMTAVGHEGPWVVVESPEKALSLATHGVAEAVGLGGVDAGLLVPQTMELQTLTKHFIKKGHVVYLLMDAGRATNARVASAEARLSTALRSHGCEVRLVGLPLRDGQDQGPDDFLAEHGASALQPLIADSESGDPVERARTAAALGTNACRALLSELPFRCTLLVGGDPVVEAVTDAMKNVAGVSADDVKAARAEGGAAFAQKRVFDRGDQVELACALIKDIGPELVHDDGRVHRHDGARWAAVPDSEVLQGVYQYAGAGVRAASGIRPLKVAAGTASGTLEVMKNMVDKPGFFAGAASGLTFADCFMMVDGRYLQKHRKSPDHRARHAYDFRFDDVVRAHRFISMLNKVWDGDEDAEAKKALLQEYVGGCLVGVGARLKKAIIFSGDTDSGKSTVLSVIQSVFPPGSVAAVRPADFTNDYHRAQLAGVLCNVVSELPETDWLEPSAFKALTGDDLINARNPYGRPFSFTSVAGHIYAANSLPRINDRSEASWNRLVIIGFRHRFHLEPKEGQKQAVRGLAQQIVEQEREGVVAWAVQGLRRLLSNKMVLTSLASSDAVVEVLRNESDQLRLFLAERLVVEPSGNPEIAWVYANYVEWSRETHHATLSKSRFGREFTTLLRNVTGLQEPRSSNHKGHRTYRGIKVAKVDGFSPFNSMEFVGKS